MTAQEVETIIDLARDKFSIGTGISAIKQSFSGDKGICIPTKGWFTMKKGELEPSENTRRRNSLRMENFEDALETFVWHFPNKEIHSMIAFDKGIEINGEHFWSLANEVFLTR